MSRLANIHGHEPTEVIHTSIVASSPHFRRASGFKSVASACFRHGGQASNEIVRERRLARPLAAGGDSTPAAAPDRLAEPLTPNTYGCSNPDRGGPQQKGGGR